MFAITKFAKDLLEVRDNLRYGLENVDKNQAEKETELEKLKTYLLQTIEGLQLTADSLDNCFRRFKVEQFNAKGQKFDPTLHEAVFTVKEADAEEGTVAVVMQTGFKIGERVLRAAKVGVVKH